MPELAPPKVLVLMRSADDAARLRQVVPRTSGGDPSDVLLTDLAADEAAQRLAAEIGTDPLASFGIVALAPADWGDVALPADCTPRELALVCTLVAKIAALRRERDELVRVRREVTQLAETDPLTGLPNRRAWERALATLRVQQPQGDPPSWLALADLDDFKSVNDRHGMAHGDRVLAAAAQALAGGVRSEDLVARLGGDEFGVLLVGTSERHVRRVLDRLRAAVAEQAGVTASIGYRKFLPADESEPLLASAETAMRQAKRAGGNRAVAAS